MKACVDAHHLGRKLKALGYDARLMPAKYVRPYSKGQKTDFPDAQAIAEAVQHPTMKFVATKTVEQLDLQALHRVREGLVSPAHRHNQSDPRLPAGLVRRFRKAMRRSRSVNQNSHLVLNMSPCYGASASSIASMGRFRSPGPVLRRHLGCLEQYHDRPWRKKAMECSDFRLMGLRNRACIGRRHFRRHALAEVIMPKRKKTAARKPDRKS